MHELPIESLAGVPCCSPAVRSPALTLAWSEARVDEPGGEGISMALWLPEGVTVAIGLGQSPEKEADAEALERDGVGLIRRQSGGGAVLLFGGVLCWEAWADLAEVERVHPGGSGIRQCYAALSKPVVDGLSRLGIEAFHAGICDVSVRVPGEERARKLAGTAQLRRRERVLVHGSLLVSADVGLLSRYLRFPSEQPDYRQGRGHGDFCTTVAGLVRPEAEGAHFMRRVAGAIASAALADGWRVLTPPAALDAAAETLLAGKYGSRRWNWERSGPGRKLKERSMAKRDKVLESMRVERKRGIKLAKTDTASTAGIEDKKEARALLDESSAELDKLQYKLYAEAKTGLLIVFQALDTGGKDGVIRKVFTPINPQGVRVTSFKRPSEVEKAHDYLWRIHRAVPAKGMIGIFNRSHYEDVLVYRVHKLLPKAVLEQRYEQINAFERYLTQNGVRILKFFLHISKDEQKRRLEARLENADKRWKFEPGDLAERKLWGRYQEAFETVMNTCSIDYAPWYVIPSDNKWYRDWAVSSIIARELKRINPRLPKPKEDLGSVVVE